MNWIFVVTWCIVGSTSSLDSTRTISFKEDYHNCDQKEYFIEKVDAVYKYNKLKSDSASFKGRISYTNIKLDSLQFDNSLSKDSLKKTQ